VDLRIFLNCEQSVLRDGAVVSLFRSWITGNDIYPKNCGADRPVFSHHSFIIKVELASWKLLQERILYFRANSVRSCTQQQRWYSCVM